MNEVMFISTQMECLVSGNKHGLYILWCKECNSVYSQQGRITDTGHLIREQEPQRVLAKIHKMLSIVLIMNE